MVKLKLFNQLDAIPEAFDLILRGINPYLIDNFFDKLGERLDEHLLSQLKETLENYEA